MLAFHGDPKIKARYLARVRKHRKADALIPAETAEEETRTRDFRPPAPIGARVDDAPPWDGEYDRGGRLPTATDYRRKR